MRVIKSLITVLVLAGLAYAFYIFLVVPFFLTNAKLVHVIDVDSLLVMEDGEIKQVQLIGVDGPDEDQCFCNEAKNSVAESYFLRSRDIRLEADTELGDKDVHGRDLRYVVLNDGSILNQKVLEEGLAKEFHLNGAKFRHKESFLDAEARAMEQYKGIWDQQGCNGNL